MYKHIGLSLIFYQARVEFFFVSSHTLLLVA